MTAYALARIKSGAKCSQDHKFYTWPLSAYGREGKALADIPDEAVFLAEKRKDGSWDCRTYGAGMPGSYGNGGIYVWGADPVELLTPMLGYKPELPRTGGQRR